MTNRPINPYVAGAPLRGETGFFGRRDTIEWIHRELRNPSTNALVLFGQRRIGKTSLLLQLTRELRSDEFLPVYFDLQDQTQRALGAVLSDLADTVAEKVGLASPGPEDFDDKGHFFERQFLPKVYEMIGSSRRLIFLFDEFDVMDQVTEAELPDSAAGKALRPFLRRLMTADLRPAFVFVVGRRAEDLSVDFMATFKSSLVYEMWVLRPEHAEALVRQAEANGSLKFTEEGVQRILSLTNYHPYLTQLLCQRLWEGAYARNSKPLPVIDIPEVEAASVDALQAGEQALTWLWNGLSPAEKIYAAALAEVSEEGQTIPEDRIIHVLAAHAARLRTREVELAPRDLIKRRVLEAAGERQYRFAIELFRRWVRLNKPVRDVKDELDRIEPVADRLYEIGHDYFRRGQWANAARFFRDALAAYPRHFRARLYLGEVLLQQGHLGEAITELQQAYELDRDEVRLPLARALNSQAEAMEKVGDEESALSIAEKALEVSPNEAKAQEVLRRIWTQRSKASLSLHKFDDAFQAYFKAGILENFADDALQVAPGLKEEEQLKVYELILRSSPNHVETLQRRQAIWLGRGELALEQNNLDAALAAFQQAGHTEKIARVNALQERQALKTRVEEAAAYERDERWDDAADVYEQLTAMAPDEQSRQEWQTAAENCRLEQELSGLFTTGMGALSQKNWKQSQQSFAAIIHHRPGYKKHGQLAASLLEQALMERRTIFSNTGALFTGMAAIAILAFGLALIYASIALRTSQTALADSYFETGNARYELGDFTAAISQFTKAIEIEPDRAEYYVSRGAAYREAEKPEAGLADLNQAIDLDPDNARSFFERALLYRIVGDFESAVLDHNAAIRLTPADSSYYFERGVTYQQMSRFDTALEDYNRAIDLDPENPERYYIRGVLYRDFANQPDQAVRDFENFLKFADRSNCADCEDVQQYIDEQHAVWLDIPNESFETNAELWEEFDPEDVQTILYDSSQAHSGRRSLRITTTGSGDYWIGTFDTPGWQPGHSYWLSIYVKTAGSGRVCMNVAAKAGHEETINCSTAISDWRLMRGTITLPNDAEHFLILLRTEFGTVYVDDVQAGLYSAAQ
jgi:tetratricopeptide (TPR) repeat protein